MKVLVALLLSVCAALAAAEVKVSMSWDKKPMTPGAKLTGKVMITFAAGKHGYQNPPTKEYQIPVKLSAPKGFALVAKYPKGVMRMTAGEESAVYEGTLEIPVTVTLPKTAGNHKIAITLDYQLCDESSCFPPASANLVTVVKVIKK